GRGGGHRTVGREPSAVDLRRRRRPCLEAAAARRGGGGGARLLRAPHLGRVARRPRPIGDGLQGAPDRRAVHRRRLRPRIRAGEEAAGEDIGAVLRGSSPPAPSPSRIDLWHLEISSAMERGSIVEEGYSYFPLPIPLPSPSPYLTLLFPDLRAMESGCPLGRW